MDIYKKLFKYVPDKKYLIYSGIFMSMISSALSILPYWYLYKFLNEFLLKKDFIYIEEKFDAILFIFSQEFCYIYLIFLMYLIENQVDIKRSAINC